MKVSSGQAWMCYCVCLCIGYVTCSTDGFSIECIPLKLCPMSLKMVTQNPFDKVTISFLRSAHCGYDENGEPKVWCTRFKYCTIPDFEDRQITLKGTCRNIKECDSFKELVLNLDATNPYIRKYLKDFRCNSVYDKEVHICCPDEEDYISNTIIPEGRSAEFLPNPHKMECGLQSIDDKILGGKEAALGESPWAVLLRYENLSRKRLLFGCGGSLISSRYVVTAAHCVQENLLTVKKLALRQLVLGEHDIRNKTDCIYSQYGEDCADEPIVFNIDYSHVTVHERFANRKDNDIALIRLPREVTFTDYIRPICLPIKQVTLKQSEKFVIVGWGRTEKEEFSPVKRRASVPFTRRPLCREYYSLSDGQICAGNGNGTDTCVGDSGGPLIRFMNVGSENLAFLLGITSLGLTNCGLAPSLYTYVPAYIDWIQENIR